MPIAPKIRSDHGEAPPPELAICGWNAVSAIFATRPQLVRRLFFDRDTAPRTAGWTRVLSARRAIYRMVGEDELARIAGTTHHGGVIAIIEDIEPEPLRVPDAPTWERAGALVVALDGIGNPHNLGAIARSAAFFGAVALVLRDSPAQARPSPAAWRTSEGGLAWLDVRLAPALPRWLEALPPSWLVVGTEVHRATDWRPVSTDLRRAPGQPTVLVLGNEETGLTPEVAQACRARWRIAGHQQRVESLNVSAAAAVLLASLATPPASTEVVRQMTGR